MYDEEIINTSNRLASLGFFTGRPEFPKLKIDGLGAQRIFVDSFPIDFNFFKPVSNDTDYKRFARSDSSYCSDSEEAEQRQGELKSGSEGN